MSSDSSYPTSILPLLCSNSCGLGTRFTGPKLGCGEGICSFGTGICDNFMRFAEIQDWVVAMKVIMKKDLSIAREMTEIISGLLGDVPANYRKGAPFVGGTSAKHYIGDGGTHNGIDANDTIISRRGLLSIHIPALQLHHEMNLYYYGVLLKLERS